MDGFPFVHRRARFALLGGVGDHDATVPSVPAPDDLKERLRA